MTPNHRLKYERERRGWSQAKVAEQIGTDAGNVSRWERGYSSPSPYYREKLCLLFGKEAYDLGLLIEEDHEYPRPDALDTAQAPSAEQHSQKEQSEALSPASQILAGLSYSLFWVTGLLLLLFYRKNRFVLFHSLQSLLLFGGVTISSIAFVGVVSSVPFDLIRVLAVLCFTVLNIGAVVAWIVGMATAFMGRYYKLPFVGDSSEKITARLMQQKRP